MNFEILRNKLFDLQHDINNFDPDAEWQKTLSGRIYKHLLSIAKKSALPLRVEGKGGPYELFHMGNEKARLIKRLQDGTVGENNGTIQTYAESWEYKHFNWWKEALDLEGLPIVFLDTPISKLAADTHIPDLESYFVPAYVIQKYCLNPSGDFNQECALQQWVQEQIIEVLNPLLGPDYEVKNYENTLRLNPKSEKAKQSRLLDNEAYDKAKNKIQQALHDLQERYDKKKVFINQNSG